MSFDTLFAKLVGAVFKKSRLNTPDDWRREMLQIMSVEVAQYLGNNFLHDKLIALQNPDISEEVSRQKRLKQNSTPKISFGHFNRGIFTEKITVEEQTVWQLFDQEDVAGRLLILGKAGSGKTTTLLELMRELLQRAENYSDNNYKKLPIFFNCSHWEPDKQPIADWLTDDLNFRYNIPPKISQTWIAKGQLLPLLDGLDELELELQKKAIEKLDEFLEKTAASNLQMVVCCRLDEYPSGDIILENMQWAICLQPLCDQQVENYLKALNCQSLWETIKDDPEGLLELSRLPFLLHIIIETYSEEVLSKNYRFSLPSQREAYQHKLRQELFDNYINHQLNKPATSTDKNQKNKYSKKNTKRWLKWLALRLKERHQTEFLLEHMQPNMLATPLQKVWYWLILWMIVCLILVLIGNLMGVSIGGITLFILVPIYSLLIVGIEEKITPSKTLSWYANNFSIKLVLWIIYYVLSCGIIFGLKGLLGGFIIGIIIFWTFKVIGGLKSREIKIVHIPNQGIIQSLLNTRSIFLITYPACVLLFVFAQLARRESVSLETVMIYGAGFAFIFALASAGIPVIQHYTLRFLLWITGAIPLNYVEFLNYATERKLMNKTGGGYRFIHHLLHEHLAGFSR